MFAVIREHPVFQAALRRRARSVVMPALIPAYDVNRRRLSFADAGAGLGKEGLPPLSFTDRTRVRIWLRTMERAFESVAEWLP